MIKISLLFGYRTVSRALNLGKLFSVQVEFPNIQNT